ncbi:MAG TPA: hypothetical protein VGK74_22105 [Symbiobacteriaceae bacterium]|jgi:hypothetical protein
MDEKTIRELMDLSDDDAHRIKYLVQAGYPEAELDALQGFWYGFVMCDMTMCRAEALAQFFKVMPGRTVADFTGFFQALWDDGLTGPLIARMLEREPVD